MRKDQESVIFRLPTDVKKKLQMQVLEEGTSIQELLEDFVYDYLGMKEEEEMLKTYKMRDGLTGAFCPISWEVNGEKIVHSFCKIEDADPKIAASTPWYPGEEEKEGDIYLVCLDQTEE